jgi:hypothetical protein
VSAVRKLRNAAMSETDDLTPGPSARLFDARGRRTDDPAHAARGDLVELDRRSGRARRVWFLSSRADLTWLPVSESSFLLWVLAALLIAWLVIGLAFGLI